MSANALVYANHGFPLDDCLALRGLIKRDGQRLRDLFDREEEAGKECLDRNNPRDKNCIEARGIGGHRQRNADRLQPSSGMSGQKVSVYIVGPLKFFIATRPGDMLLDERQQGYMHRYRT